MNYETLTHEIADGILTLTLNRPDKLNAFVLRMGEELIQAFNEASENDEVRAIVVTGAGRAFCAGMDLKAFLAGEKIRVEGRGILGMAFSPPKKPMIIPIFWRRSGSGRSCGTRESNACSRYSRCSAAYVHR